MKNLKEVTLEFRERLITTSHGQVRCHHSKNKPEDRKLHRDGMCIVHLGTLHGHCPNLARFNGVELGGMSKSFSQWNNKMKELFYEDYINQGGEMDFKAWSVARWFKKPCKVPSVYGRNRLPIPQ